MPTPIAARSIAAALEAARIGLAELDRFEWPAYSDREGDAIAAGEKALRDVVAFLEEVTSTLEVPGSNK
jgi:hypothetical protein